MTDGKNFFDQPIKTLKHSKSCDSWSRWLHNCYNIPVRLPLFQKSLWDNCIRFDPISQNFVVLHKIYLATFVQKVLKNLTFFYFQKIESTGYNIIFICLQVDRLFLCQMWLLLSFCLNKCYRDSEDPSGDRIN